MEIGEKKPITEQATDEEIIATYRKLCEGDITKSRALEKLIERFGEKAVVKLMSKLMK